MMKRLYLCVCLLFLFSCKRGELRYSRTFFALGTVCTIKSDLKDVSFCQEYLEKAESVFSFHNPQSELSLLNSAAGPVKTGDELFDLVCFAVEMAKNTGGLYNPAVGAITELWWENGSFSRLPSDEEIKSALEHSDWRDIDIDRRNHVIHLTKKGMKLDLGGIAKGHVADRLSELLRQHGSESFIINLGGDIKVGGKKSYRIGIQEPGQPTGTCSQVVEAGNCSVVTSGAYERNFTADGVFYHHIIDPRSGYPCAVIHKSVTIVCDSCAMADAYATAYFINPELGLLPPEKVVFI